VFSHSDADDADEGVGAQSMTDESVEVERSVGGPDELGRQETDVTPAS
jgi:hypothetical protein